MKGQYLHKSTQGFQKGHTINVGNTWNVGKKLSIETCQKLSSAKIGNQSAKGSKRSAKHRQAISNAQMGNIHFIPKYGKDNPSWKGGITPINKVIRKSKEYKLWRATVFERDNYACIWCKIRSGKGIKVTLHADHIKPFALYPELRFAKDNGRTLCEPCHRNTDTFAGRIKNYYASKNNSIQKD